MERVQDADVQAGFPRRPDCRGVEHLRAVGRKRECRFVADLRDGACALDVLGVGGHDARHVGPYLEIVRTERRGEQRRSLVRPAAPQCADVPAGVRPDEARHHEHFHLRVVADGLGNFLVCVRLIHGLVADADEIARVQPQGVDPVAAQLRRNYSGGEQLSEGQIVFGLRIHQVFVGLQHCLADVLALFSRKQSVDDRVVSVKQGFTCFLTVRRLHLGHRNQGVRASADGGAHEHHFSPGACAVHDVEHPRNRRGVGH